MRDHSLNERTEWCTLTICSDSLPAPGAFVVQYDVETWRCLGAEAMLGRGARSPSPRRRSIARAPEACHGGPYRVPRPCLVRRSKPHGRERLESLLPSSAGPGWRQLFVRLMHSCRSGDLKHRAENDPKSSAGHPLIFCIRWPAKSKV